MPRGDFPFTCTKCRKPRTFDDQEALANEIQKTSKYSLDKYADDHEGVIWRRPPLLPIAPSRMVPCSLHLLLSTAKSLWRWGIAPHITSDDKKEKLEKLLTECGMGRVAMKVAKRSDKDSDFTKLNFVGSDAWKLIQRFEEFVQTLVPADDEGGAGSVLVSEAFADVWDILRSKVADDDERAKKQKAEELKTAAVKYVNPLSSQASHWMYMTEAARP